MAKQRFSRNYVKCIQDKIEIAINERDFNRALGLIDHLPVGQTVDEKVDRLVVQNEGYRAIVMGLRIELGDSESKLTEYKTAFGDPNDLHRAAKKLSDLGGRFPYKHF